MLVHCHCMLDRGLHELGLAVGTDGDRAVHLTRELAAVDELASHSFLPSRMKTELGRPSGKAIRANLHFQIQDRIADARPVGVNPPCTTCLRRQRPPWSDR